MLPIQYKGYTIKKSEYLSGKYEFSKQEGDRSMTADSIDEAKDLICEIIMTKEPMHLVKLNDREYPFNWIEDAVRFATQWGAELLTPIHSI